MCSLKMAASESGSGKKKKKQKKAVFDLATFQSMDIGGGASPGALREPPKKMNSWADASEDLDVDETTEWLDRKPAFDKSVLPSAPRASTEHSIDLNQLPKHPPYTVYLGNLSYDCTEKDIAEFFERKNLKVESVRLPREAGGRLRGFGYAEVMSIPVLKDVLSLNKEFLMNRPVNIDMAGGRNQGEEGGRERGGWGRGADDTTPSNWRRESEDDARGSSNRFDWPRRGSRDHYDREDGYSREHGRERGAYSHGGGGGGGPWGGRHQERGEHSRNLNEHQDDRAQHRGGRGSQRESPPPERPDRGASGLSSAGQQNHESSPGDAAVEEGGGQGRDREDLSCREEGSGRERDGGYNSRKERDYDDSFGDLPPQKYGPRGGYEDRPPRGGYEDRPPRSGYEDRLRRGGYEDRPPRDRYEDRPPRDRYEDRPPRDRYEDHPPRRGYEDRSSRGRYEDRPPRGGYEDRPLRGGYEDRPPRGGYGDRPSRGGYEDPPPRGSSYGNRSGYQDDRRRATPEREEPATRPKLQLQPRSKPAGVETTSGPSSIFGGAKPVDTRVREKQIEERLQKERAMMEVGRERKGSEEGRERKGSEAGRERKGSEAGREQKGSEEGRERKGSEEGRERDGESGDREKGRGRRERREAEEAGRPREAAQEEAGGRGSGERPGASRERPARGRGRGAGPQDEGGRDAREQRDEPGKWRRRRGGGTDNAWSRGKPKSLGGGDPKRDEKPVTILKKQEEPAQPTFSQPSRFAALEDEESSAGDCPYSQQ